MNAHEPRDPLPLAAEAAAADETADAAPAKPRRRRAAAKAETMAQDLLVEPVVTSDATALATDLAPARPARARKPRKPAAVEPQGSADEAPATPPVAAVQGTPDTPDTVDDASADTPRPGSRRKRRRKRRDRAERSERGAHEGDADAAPGDEREAAEDLEPLPGPVLPAFDPGELFAQLLSGAFDSEASAEEAPADTAAAAPRRVLAPEPDAPKLQKVLAQAGIGSRRDMEQWVLEGRVTINGEPAHTGQRISFGDRVAVNGKPVKLRIAPPPPRVLAYHKPVGEVVTHDDPQHRPTVFRRLPRLPHGKWQSVGRLDINTEGLLLFTNSGELANQLMHPRFGVEREYAVRSLGELDAQQRQRLLDGVEIDGQRAAFVSIEDGGGEGVNHWYRVIITEGRNREVRKLFDAVGHAVSRLIRIRYGCVVLPRGLRRGNWVDLPEPDVRALRRLTGTERPRPGAHTADEGGARDRRGRRGRRARDGRREPIFDQGRERAPRPEIDEDGPMHIPNPLQQTYDKRFIQQARRPQREFSEDGPIPNPLQQTYDKRALQRDRMPQRELPEDGPIPNPLQQTYDKRFVQKGSPGGAGGRRGARSAGPRGPGARQPDPMQTTMGYLGANALRGISGKAGKGAKGGKGGRRSGGAKRSGRGGNRSG